MTYEDVIRFLVVGQIDFTSQEWSDVATSTAAIDERMNVLAQLGALVGMGSSDDLYTVVLDHAIGAGLTRDEVVAALLALGPLVGTARLVAAASSVAAGLGIDVDALLEGDETRDR